MDLAGFTEYVWKRRRIIASEDVEPADPHAALQIRVLYESWLELRKKDNKRHAPERLFLVHPVLYLALAPKSRIVDHALIVHHEGPRERREIPDFALDHHTQRGRVRERGHAHFWQHGVVVHPDAKLDDPYAGRALDSEERAGRASRIRPMTTHQTLIDSPRAARITAYMTGLEVLDTALKIGLGSTLGGFFTWIGMRSAHNHELEKDRRRRKQDAVEKIAQDFETVSRVYVSAGSEATALGLGVGAVEKCLSAISSVGGAHDDLTAVDGRLRLFGLHAAAEKLEQFQLLADELRGVAVNAVGEMRKISSDEMARIMELGVKLRAAREAFYECLSEGHREP